MFRLDSAQVQTVIDYAEQMRAVAPDRVLKALARSEAIDWSDCREVESIPGKGDGMALLKGTSVPAVVISDDAEYSNVEVLAHGYGVDPTTVQAVLDYIRTEP